MPWCHDAAPSFWCSRLCSPLQVSVMSYSAKFASCFYGPFRWVCPSGGIVPSQGWADQDVCPWIVIWERASDRAWATAGATLVALQCSPTSWCKRESSVPCPGKAGWWEDHLDDLPSHPFNCSSWVLVASWAGRELPAAARSSEEGSCRSQCCCKGWLQGQASVRSPVC